MGSFYDGLDASFPGAVRAVDYLDGLQRTIEGLGFTPERTLALISVCRDELTARFVDQIHQRWGSAFTLAGLGGVPALGRTGWTAALSHVPDRGGRGAMLVLGFPHIGIEEDGSVGVTIRRGQDGATPTCGALASLFGRATVGDLPTAVDVDDYEASRLALRLIEPDSPPASLTELTIAALEAIEIDLWHALDGAEVWRSHDVTVWCGVQIHGHGGEDWIWPRDAWVTGADGDRRRV